jgi:hypothetical protein
VSVEALALVFHHSETRGTTRNVLMAIANHHGEDGAWPSMPTIAFLARTDERRARREIRAIEAMGELRVDIQGGGTRRTTRGRNPNRYVLLIRCPDWCDRSTTRTLAPRANALCLAGQSASR